MKEFMLTFCAFAFVTDQVLRYYDAQATKKRYRAKTRALARVMNNADPRLSWSATRLGQAIKAGDITSLELTQLFMEHLDRINLYTNAMVASRFDRAMMEARKADSEVSSSRAAASPFWGVPIFSKEVFELPGMPYSAGVVSLAKRYGAQTCYALQKVQAAGLIILGTGNTSEQCMWMEASNNVHGRTNNPFDAARTVGGSSGGTACVVSALGAPLAVTSDVGGSTRIPSLFNGVFGLKPTGGSVSNQGTTPPVRGRVNMFCQLGPCARHAEDLLPLLKILAGSANDEQEYPTTGESPNWTSDQVPISSIRVLNVMRQPGTETVPLVLFRKPRQKEMLAAQERVAMALRQLGCESITETDFPLLSHAFDIWGAYMGRETASHPFREILAEGKPGAGSLFWVTTELVKFVVSFGRGSDHTLPALSLGMLESYESLFPGKNRRLIEQGETLKRELSAALGTDGVMLVPSLPTAAPHHGPLHFLVRASESGATGLFNVLEFPAAAVPLGLDENGMPIGIQVVANHGRDHLCLSVARALEEAHVAGWSLPQ